MRAGGAGAGRGRLQPALPSLLPPRCPGALSRSSPPARRPRPAGRPASAPPRVSLPLRRPLLPAARLWARGAGHPRPALSLVQRPLPDTVLRLWGPTAPWQRSVSPTVFPNAFMTASVVEARGLGWREEVGAPSEVGKLWDLEVLFAPESSFSRLGSAEYPRLSEVLVESVVSQAWLHAHCTSLFLRVWKCAFS